MLAVSLGDREPGNPGLPEKPFLPAIMFGVVIAGVLPSFGFGPEDD